MATDLAERIRQKKKELQKLVEQKKSFEDDEVYRKSVELDTLVVQFMKCEGKSQG